MCPDASLSRRWPSLQCRTFPEMFADAYIFVLTHACSRKKRATERAGLDGGCARAYALKGAVAFARSVCVHAAPARRQRASSWLTAVRRGINMHRARLTKARGWLDAAEWGGARRRRQGDAKAAAVARAATRATTRSDRCIRTRARVDSQPHYRAISFSAETGCEAENGDKSNPPSVQDMQETLFCSLSFKNVMTAFSWRKDTIRNRSYGKNVCIISISFLIYP